MAQDHSHHDSDAAAPPDRAAAGDVSTTGHSTHDAHDAHGATAGHDDNGHGGHGGHGDDAAEVSTLVPTNWKQLIFPALILLLVAILVAGPLFGAFASRPPASTTPAPAEQHNGGNEGEGAPTPGSEVESTPHSNAPENPVSQAQPTTTSNTPATEAPPPAASPTDSALSPSAIATRTAVRVAGEQGDVARVPVQIEFGGATFTVKSGTNLLPDWKPTQDVGLATWIDGTYANHILYLPFSAENETLFKGAKPGDMVRVVMNTGQVFEFAITRSERVVNGPPTQDGQFTVSTAMAQDHAGVTLFLVGDPAADRAVVQADFTGTIQ
ncbi:MAG TPA: hypothetical protein VFH60_09285 [Chloroflexia bacterium]|nr:hypothetical protein [Chloroflexia bacterium]